MFRFAQRPAAWPVHQERSAGGPGHGLQSGLPRALGKEGRALGLPAIAGPKMVEKLRNSFYGKKNTYFFVCFLMELEMSYKWNKSRQSAGY